MNDSLVLETLNPKDHGPYIRDVEARCRKLNKKYYFKYPLFDGYAFAWTRRNDRRLRLHLIFSDWEDERRHAPLVDLDDNLQDQFVAYLEPFMAAFVDYCNWQLPVSWE